MGERAQGWGGSRAGACCKSSQWNIQQDKQNNLTWIFTTSFQGLGPSNVFRFSVEQFNLSFRMCSWKVFCPKEKPRSSIQHLSCKPFAKMRCASLTQGLRVTLAPLLMKAAYVAWGGTGTPTRQSVLVVVLSVNFSFLPSGYLSCLSNAVLS